MAGHGRCLRMSDHGHGLVFPFLDGSPAFAHGVEIGLLHARMRDGGEGRIETYCLIDNQEQITLMANRQGWRVLRMKAGPEGWFWCEMERAA